VDSVPVLTPARLLGLLRSLPAHMDQVGVMLLAEHARHQLHPRHLNPASSRAPSRICTAPRYFPAGGAV
jgi:hypothetical protein